MRAVIRAPEPVIEDACQFAWSQLVSHRRRVSPETAYGWLVSTALREALRLLRAARHEVSLERELEHGGERLLDRAGRRPLMSRPVDELVLQREQVDVLRILPRRQQRMLWLNAIGLSRRELACLERCTARTVERQLFNARRSLRLEADAA